MNDLPELQYHQGRAVFPLRGNLNLHDVGALKRYLLNELEKSRERLEVLELMMEEVESIDSSMLALIYQLHRILKTRGKNFLLRRPSTGVMHTLNLTAMDRHLRIEY